MVQTAPFLQRQEKNCSGLARGLSKGWVPEKGRIGAIKTTMHLRALEVLVTGLSRPYRTRAWIRRRSTLSYLFLTLQCSQWADHSVPLWESVWGSIILSSLSPPLPCGLQSLCCQHPLQFPHLLYFLRTPLYMIFQWLIIYHVHFPTIQGLFQEFQQIVKISSDSFIILSCEKIFCRSVVDKHSCNLSSW